MDLNIKHPALTYCIYQQHQVGFSPIFFPSIFFSYRFRALCVMEPLNMLNAFFVIILALSSGTECIYILINLFRD